MTKKRMFFDIETSFNIGVFFNTGYSQVIMPEDIIHERAIICICWKWEGSNEVHSVHWTKEHSDGKLLKEFLKELNKADEIIAHNGDKFDMKWLRTRALLNGVRMSPYYNTVDTLKLARRFFRFNSNKLDYLAQLMGVGSKMKHEGRDLWKKVVLNSDKTSLNTMIEYCKQDVIILEKVYNKLKNYSLHQTHFAVLNGEEKFQCPECSSCNVRLTKTFVTALGTVKRQLRCKDKSCDRSFTVSNKTYQDYLKFRIKHGY